MSTISYCGKQTSFLLGQAIGFALRVVGFAGDRNSKIRSGVGIPKPSQVSIPTPTCIIVSSECFPMHCVVLKDEDQICEPFLYI